jgi:hypothetical protein
MKKLGTYFTKKFRTPDWKMKLYYKQVEVFPN